MNEIYLVRYTTAPSAYDYGYVIEDKNVTAYRIDREALPIRRVLIPEDSVKYQTDRYRSGMHLVCDSSDQVKELGYYF